MVELFPLAALPLAALAGFALGYRAHALGVLAALLALALLAAPAFATMQQERDPVHLTGSAGGPINWGRLQSDRHLARGRPLILSGRYVSAGTYLLHAVERLPGSCIMPNARFEFHGAAQLSPLSFLIPINLPLPPEEAARANRIQTDAYNPALSAWFLANVEAGNISHNRFLGLWGHELGAHFGYPVCAHVRPVPVR